MTDDKNVTADDELSAEALDDLTNNKGDDEDE
jgi:hypothetical protein